MNRESHRGSIVSVVLGAGAAVGVAAAQPASVFETTELSPNGLPFASSVQLGGVTGDGDWSVSAEEIGGSNREFTFSSIFPAAGEAVEYDGDIFGAAHRSQLASDGTLYVRSSEGILVRKPGDDEPRWLLRPDEDVQLTEFLPGSFWERVFDMHVNDVGDVLIFARIRAAQPGGGFQDRSVLAKITDLGEEREETLIYTAGDPIDGLPTSTSFLPNSDQLAINNAGDIVFLAQLSGVGFDTDSVVVLNGSIVLREGDPSPIPGEVYGELRSFGSVDINNNGVWAVQTKIPGFGEFTGFIATSEGTVVAAEGETVVNDEGFFISRISANNFYIADNGDVAYFAQWRNPSVPNDIRQGVVVNSTPIVVHDATEVMTSAGTDTVQLVQGMGNQEFKFVLSEDGSKLAFAAHADERQRPIHRRHRH
ncbi:MAG: hypothetical protein ACFHWZ_07575 [Phycisphaerales bacterium]